jgi:hypothetical protein
MENLYKKGRSALFREPILESGLAQGETTTLNRASRLCTQLCLQLMNLFTKTVEIKESLPWMNYRF